MSRILPLSNLIEAVDKEMITVSNVRSESKVSEEYTDKQEVETDKFIDSLRLLHKTIFSDAVDMHYEYKSEGSFIIKCEIKNAFMEEIIYADCVLNRDTDKNELEKVLHKTIFDKIPPRKEKI